MSAEIANFFKAAPATKEAKHRSSWHCETTFVVVAHQDGSFSSMAAEQFARATAYLPGRIVARFQRGKKVAA